MSSGKTRVIEPKNGDQPSPLELALACLVVTLEERDRGFADRWVEHAENDALHADIRRLHTTAPNPVLVANLLLAMNIARRVRFIVKANVQSEPVAERKRRKGRG